MPIRVAYDVQVLGRAMRSDSARTGVARVVDHVARRIAADPACRVRFCNGGPWTLHPSCAQYLRDALGRPAAAVAPRAAFTPAHRVGHWSQIDGRRGSRFRAVRAVAARGSDALARWYARRRTELAAAVDVYHSPFHPLPADVGRGRAGPARMLTVYDLIPVLHPEWFPADGGRTIRDGAASILQSLRPTDHVHCISESTRADLLNAVPSLDPARVFVAPLAADGDTFHPRSTPERVRAVGRHYGVPDGRYVLSVCTLEPRKNVDSVVRAFGRVVAQERLTDLSLVLVGANGWDGATIDRVLAEGRAAGGRVVVTGFVPDADLAPLYTGATAFVYPSRYEGFGLPPLEAMCCGVPVITSNVSSLPEVVGDAGLMVDPSDLDGLCQAMLTLVQRPDVRQSLARRASARAATFSWAKCVGRIVAEYHRAVGRTLPQGPSDVPL